MKRHPMWNWLDVHPVADAAGAAALVALFGFIPAVVLVMIGYSIAGIWVDWPTNVDGGIAEAHGLAMVGGTLVALFVGGFLVSLFGRGRKA